MIGRPHALKPMVFALLERNTFQDKRNFTRDPPAGQKVFSFSFEEKFPVALVSGPESAMVQARRLCCGASVSCAFYIACVKTSLRHTNPPKTQMPVAPGYFARG